ncbi:MAG: hypothetical protein AAF492_00440 [Verrucomicrobiota bacterium]
MKHLIVVACLALGTAHAAERFSSGSKTWDTDTAQWGKTSGGPYTAKTWNNKTPDSAVFEGSPGTVTVKEPVRVKNITFTSKQGGTVLSGEKLNFVEGGVIDQTVRHIDHTITAPISGKPDVRIINNSGGVYKGLIFAPSRGSQALGIATVPYNDNTRKGDKGGLTLGGSTTGNSVEEVRFEGGNRYADLRKEGSGTWTLGNVSVGTLKIASGTLVINGTVNLPYSGLQFSGGTLAGAAAFKVPVSVPAAGRLAPGGPVGPFSVEGRLDLSAPAAGPGQLIFELDALDRPNDRIKVNGTANIGDGVMGLSDFNFTNLGGMEAGTYVLLETTEGIVGRLDPDDRIGRIGTFSGNLQIKGNNLEWASDADGDGMPDDFELAHTEPPSPTAMKPDADLEHGGKGDGLKNLDEYLRDTDPNHPDSDGDGLEDGPELAGAEQRPPTDPANPDTDGDGLNDGVESNTGQWRNPSDTGTDPTRVDTDADGLADTVETHTGKHRSAADTGTDPLNPNTDGDNAGDWFELYGCSTDPNDPKDSPSLPYPLPRSNGGNANSKKPVKVFILSGQSNMVGFGRRDGSGPGTLDTMVKVDKRFPHLLDDNGHWIAREHVYYRGVISDIGNGPLGPSVAGGSFGPELGFGLIMDHIHDEPVLIIKSCIGNRSLSWDCLPPGSKGFDHSDGYTYAGYGESPGRWETGATPQPIWWYAGKQYDDFFLDEADMGPRAWNKAKEYDKGFQVRHKGTVYVSRSKHTSSPANEPGADGSGVWSVYSVFNVTDILDNFAAEYPQWAEQGFEIAGFAWWQGHKDQGEPAAGRYESNLVNLIKSLRQYYGKRYPGRVAEDAPFVLSTIAFEGWDLAGAGLTVAKGQLAVSGETGRHPEFAGNVKTIEARGYWRDASVSPKNQGFHYNHNAETYLLVGDALGRAMADLLKARP